MEDKNGNIETWAILEIMGHSKFAGFCRSVPLGGAAMIRIDVPEVNPRGYSCSEWDEEKKYYEPKLVQPPTLPAFTKFFGVSSIFSITPTTEELAREAATQFCSPPVTLLSMPERKALPGHSDDIDEGHHD